MAEYDDILTTMTGNRRQYSRVGACVPFAYRVISPQEACYMKSRTVSDAFLTDFNVMPNVEDQLYGEWLKLVNAKLDEIIRMLTLQRDGFSVLPFKPICISGNGLSFLSPECLGKGAIIEVKIVLTIIHAVALFLYGEVVTVESAENGWRVGMQFIQMDDLVRDEIIRFVFEREREMIREKRGD